ncbi:hypothetical protein D3C85_1091550 [compost metagenome]
MSWLFSHVFQVGERRRVVAAIIDNQHVVIGVGRRAKRFDAVAQQVRVVVGRHDDRHRRAVIRESQRKHADARGLGPVRVDGGGVDVSTRQCLADRLEAGAETRRLGVS